MNICITFMFLDKKNKIEMLRAELCGVPCIGHITESSAPEGAKFSQTKHSLIPQFR